MEFERTLKLFIIFFLVGVITPVQAKDPWKEHRARHFLIYYKDVPEDFVKAVEDQAEQYFDEISDNLGFRRLTIWSFDDRAKIYIYNDQEDYVDSAKQFQWSHGAANTKEKTIRTFPSAHGFFDSTLPHELGHIIFREFVGYKSSIPLWFDEGVAMFQEKAKRWGSNQMVKEALETGQFIPLTELSRVRLTNQTSRDIIDLYYAEAASIVYFMITEFGEFRFAEFCRLLERGYDFNNALYTTYVRLENMDDLNKTWVRYLKD